MLTALTAAAVSGLISLLVARYQQQLKEDSKKETVVYVKNAKDFKESASIHAPNDYIKDPEILNQRLYIKIPLPYPSELTSFINFITRWSLIFLLLAGTIVVFDEQSNLSEYWTLPYYFVLISTLLYFVYVIFENLRLNGLALCIYYGVIIVSFVWSLYYLFHPKTNLLIDIADNQWIKIIELSFITTQYCILQIPSSRSE